MKANELTIKDLMIGDWVVINNIPRQVTFIDDCLNYKIIARGKHPNSGRVSYVGKLSEEVKPIPLTPEILEKNGFVYYDLTVFWMWKGESSEPIHLDNYDKDGWRLRINCNNIPCECKYVHQLQHALRLFGIEKEIEL